MLRNADEWGRVAMRLTVLTLGAAMLGACATQQQPVIRSGAADSPISATVEVPPGAVVYVSGTVPDVANPAAPARSVERYGDTEAQTRSVLSKIDALLAQRGMTLGDVVMMRVFLAAPPGQPRMDFAGMMRAYRERFGTPEQPNRPARSTMQVAGLVDPGWLVEIEVTAARK
jgi:enamine deaminase RidA (YjgF/YER057c/UK114 family)